jgi:acyl CoA:acetate/3-ketoacid CoA transferase alpha subunit
MAINKVVDSFDEAVADLADGAVLLIGGFGGPGECPSYLIAATARKAVKDLTIVGNSGGWGPQLIEVLRTRMAVLLHIPPDWYDPGLLVERGQVRKGILSFPAAPAHIYTPFEKAVMDGKVELELIGQGSLCERMRAAKGGIAAFYTPVGVGTIVEEGKEVREFDGRKRRLHRYHRRGGRGGGGRRPGPRADRDARGVRAASGGAPARAAPLG